MFHFYCYCRFQEPNNADEHCHVALVFREIRQVLNLRSSCVWRLESEANLMTFGIQTWSTDEMINGFGLGSVWKVMAEFRMWNYSTQTETCWENSENSLEPTVCFVAVRIHCGSVQNVSDLNIVDPHSSILHLTS